MKYYLVNLLLWRLRIRTRETGAKNGWRTYVPDPTRIQRARLAIAKRLQGDEKGFVCA